MIYSLSGTVQKLSLPHVVMQVSGVGYILTVPSPVWDELTESTEATLIIYTYVREDRLDLFGFQTHEDRAMFSSLLNVSGIGPKTALELCSIPRAVLLLAAKNDDVTSLAKVKGIGRKTAEKLLVDLKQMIEKNPAWAASTTGDVRHSSAAYDDDAIAALATLGYDRSTIVAALERLPKDMKKTEERVTAALRSL